jgi:uncharacterized protein YacL
MLLIIIRILYALICIGAIATYVSTAGLPAIFQGREVLVFFVMLLVSQIVTLIDIFIPRKRVEVISSTYFGLLIGVLLSYLLILAMEPVIKDSPMRGPLVMLTTLILPYLCISMLMQTKDDFRFIIPYIEFSRELKGGRPLILDSSALIDGRIAEVVDTNILDAQMIVPEFVLLEVQEIADSHDRMRRNRGRRGLDVLNKLQNNPDVDVKVYETKDRNDQGVPVDQRLVLLAKELGGRVVTNDFNLNKVAKVQGVDVINLNDVANSLKPRYLPGEHLRIKVIKEGESQGQGVGYLDDGTMVVCEQASALIGEETDIIVTSVLQSSAGRMIFGRLGNVPARQ